VLVVPRGHPLATEAAAGQAPALQRLAAFPLVTYEPGYTGRGHIDEAFARAGLDVHIVLQAMDADVIKTYVELGLGVGLIAAIAYDPVRDPALHGIATHHLFEANTTRLALRRGSYLRDFGYAFISTFAPTLTRAVVEQALAPGDRR
jgi:LysR family cys regulon transcriptional activator